MGVKVKKIGLFVCVFSFLLICGSGVAAGKGSGVFNKIWRVPAADRVTSALAKMRSNWRQKALVVSALTVVPLCLSSCSFGYPEDGSSRTMTKAEVIGHYVVFERGRSTLVEGYAKHIYSGQTGLWMKRRSDGRLLWAERRDIAGILYTNHNMLGEEVSVKPPSYDHDFAVYYGTVETVYVRPVTTWYADNGVKGDGDWYFPRSPVAAYVITVHGGIDREGTEVYIEPYRDIFYKNRVSKRAEPNKVKAAARPAGK